MGGSCEVDAIVRGEMLIPVKEGRKCFRKTVAVAAVRATKPDVSNSRRGLDKVEGQRADGRQSIHFVSRAGIDAKGLSGYRRNEAAF